MNRIIAIICLVLIALTMSALGGYFTASGLCAKRETKAINEAVKLDNESKKASIEYKTKIEIQEREVVKKIYKIKYVKTNDDCPLPSVSQFMRDIHEAATSTYIQ